MDVLGYVFTSLGDFINGAMQVVTDFINMIIEVLPNPDPFPEMIENLDTTTAADMGFMNYWLDNFFGIQGCSTIIAIWAALMVAGTVFAVVYWIVKAIKP